MSLLLSSGKHETSAPADTLGREILVFAGFVKIVDNFQRSEGQMALPRQGSNGEIACAEQR